VDCGGGGGGGGSEDLGTQMKAGGGDGLRLCCARTFGGLGEVGLGALATWRMPLFC
jgi:hypothetical protein